MKPRLAAVILAVVCMVPGPSRANDLDVAIVQEAGDGQAADCATSTVTGLKAGRDGFLAVRSGPGADYRKLDELRNGETVTVFEIRGEWAGITYRTAAVSCSTTRKRVIQDKNKGWVHMRWLKPLAG